MGLPRFTLGITATAAGSSTAISVRSKCHRLDRYRPWTIAYLPAPVFGDQEDGRPSAGQTWLPLRIAAVGTPKFCSHTTRAGALDALPALYVDWDRWASEVADGHTK